MFEELNIAESETSLARFNKRLLHTATDIYRYPEGAVDTYSNLVKDFPHLIPQDHYGMTGLPGKIVRMDGDTVVRLQGNHSGSQLKIIGTTPINLIETVAYTIALPLLVGPDDTILQPLTLKPIKDNASLLKMISFGEAEPEFMMIDPEELARL